MNALIKISPSSIDGHTVQTVNARDLHSFLQVGKDFSNWIKDRIEQYGFVQNQDFTVFTNSGENPKGGRPAKEYHISLDMAKELAMVERNEKGKQARQYFIECERQAKQVFPAQMLDDPVAMRGMLLSYTEKVIALEQEKKQMQPKVAALDRIATANGSLCITDAAKTLQVQPKKLFVFMVQHQWIYRRAGGSGYIAYQDKIQQLVLEHKVTVVQRDDGSEKVIEQVRVTPKGMTRLALLLKAQKAA